MAYRIRQTRKSLTVQVTIIIFIITLSLHLFLQSNFFLLDEVEIINSKNLSEEKILELVDITKNTNIFYLDLRSIENKLELHPMVKHASIFRELPGKVIIKIEERIPRAVLPTEEGFILVDEELVILKKLSQISDVNLPLLSGIELQRDFYAGEKINSPKLEKMIDEIITVWEKAQAYFSEINITDENNIKMYTHEGIEVYFGELTNFENKFKLFQSMYNERNQEGNWENIDYIDLSFEGLPVIKYK